MGSFIKEGMERKAIIQEFGEPWIESTNVDGTLDDTYMSSPTNVTVGTVFGGFDVSYKGNRVWRWVPIYSDNTDLALAGRPRQVLDSVRGSINGTNELAFYIVEHVQPPHAVYFDTPAFPNLGFIKTKADAVFTNIQSAELRVVNAAPPAGGTRYEINLSLKQTDAKAFEKLTSENIAKPMLMMINHTAIAAPVVTSPISGGEMRIRLRDKKTAEDAMATIKKLIK